MCLKKKKKEKTDIITNRKIKIDSYPMNAKEEGCEVGRDCRSRGKGQKVEGTDVRQLQLSGPQKGGGQHAPAMERMLTLFSRLL